VKKRHSFFRHTEGKILIFGLGMLGAFLLLILFSTLLFPKATQTLLSITATNMLFGRMAGLSIGIAAQVDTLFLILFSFFIEAIMVLLLYPLFVQSWNRLEIITYKPLHTFFERAQESSRKYQTTIQKYGIFGLLFFVLTPLAMTGPVVGSFVGYMMGFSHTKTLSTILTATLLAVTLWVYLIGHFKTLLVTYSHWVSMGFLVAAIGMGVWYVVKRYLLKGR